MDDREQKILDIIKEQTSGVQIPESLGPEQIEKMLDKQPKKITKRNYWSKGLAAACILLLCGSVYALEQMNEGTMDAALGMSKAAIEDTNVEDGNDEIKGLVAASGYEDIYQYVDAYWKEVEAQNRGVGIWDLATGGMAVEDSAVATESIATEEKSSQASHSETNVRQEGVDEADVVKTDGEYIYALQDAGEAISIVSANAGSMEAVGKIEAGENVYIREFYITGDNLIYVASKYSEEYDAIMPRKKSIFTTELVVTVTYDISDIANPIELGSVSQSGTYAGSRMVGGYLYVFSESYMNSRGEAEKPETYIPLVNDEVLTADSIYLPITSDAYIYEIITTISLDKPSEIYDSKAIFTKGGQVYVSNENIYWYETQWRDDTFTTIRKLSYKDGIIEPVAAEEIGGYINDSFSIDEYEGYLRVVTTEGDSNNVYVMNTELEIVGEIHDIAKDERVYSARFMDEIGYFVTFRETDPLFSVDFSNPKEPVIIGELKIPGFSEYLHFYGEDKLLGIGMDVDEETGVTGGVKLSMFDISDPSDVKEDHTYIMKNTYSADVFWDYRAVLIDENKNVIGFSAYSDEEKYYVFSYEEAGFEKQMEEAVNGNGYQTTRGLYIEDILYVVKGNIIESYNMLGYEKIDDIII